MRELCWAAESRREFEGDVVAAITSAVAVAVWAPNELAKFRDLNPFREPRPESEAMTAHRALLNDLRWRSMTGG